MAIPARFSASTSALQCAAEANDRALIEAARRAGGKPATIHPASLAATCLARFDGVPLPGDGLAPHRHGATDIDDRQDAFDLEAARKAPVTGLPLPTVCRGPRAVDIVGGTLEQDMGGPERKHRRSVHPTASRRGALQKRATGAGKTEASGHHQQADRPCHGPDAAAHAADGTAEGLELPGVRGRSAAVHRRAEDTAHEDPAQQGLFDALVRAARGRG